MKLEIRKMILVCLVNIWLNCKNLASSSKVWLHDTGLRNDCQLNIRRTLYCPNHHIRRNFYRCYSLNIQNPDSTADR